MLTALAACCTAPLLRAADGEAGWELHKEDPALPIRVWLRDRPGELPAFRASTIISARLASLAAVLTDAARTQEWVYRVRKAQVLRSDGPQRGVTLVVTSMPLFLSDRESIVNWELRQDPGTRIVTLAGSNAAELPQQDPERVRMPAIESRWTLTPRADGRVDVLFEGSGDPGGSLSGPVLRQLLATVVWEAPWHTVRGLHEIVRLPEYAQAQLAFIQEPEPK